MCKCGENCIAQKLKTYRDDVLRTAPVDKPVKDFMIWAALGLCEAGEVQNAVKKYAYQGGKHDREEILSELGDLFFYMAAFMIIENIDLVELIDFNMEKRKDFVPGIGRPLPTSVDEA